MRIDFAFGVCCACLLFATPLRADNDSTEDVRKFDTRFSGYTYIEAGEVVKGLGYQDNVVYDHRWLSDLCIGIFGTTRIDKHLRVLMGLEGQLTSSFNAYYQEKVDFVPLRHPMNSFWVSKGEGIYTFGDTTKNSLQIEAGYFPYKYNKEVRNLGEYLFRTYCYPPIMLNLFDRTYTELMGLRVGHTAGGFFHHDLIINSEIKQYPFYDFSFSYLFDISNPSFAFMRKFITVGGGIQLYRAVPVRGDLTNRHDNNDRNLIKRDTVSRLYNPVTQDTQYVVDEQWMGFAGTKVMGRATMDIKGFFPEKVANFFGAEDLKLYGEIAVLGLQNYDKFFEDRSQRTPFTIGFNIPTCKILDILNVEVEYLKSPYMNSTYEPVFSLVPLQYTDTTTKHENLKWSIYVKKSIGKRMSLMAQVANDHLIPKSAHDDPTIQDYHDVTLRHGDWWWNFRARFDF